MAENKAYRLTVTLEAGTAKFFTDLRAAGVEVREFEKKAAGFGKGAISEAKATTAAMKALEGGFLNNAKAADKFLEAIGGGKVAAAIFPVVGAVALVGAAFEAGKKSYEFFKGMAEAPERINAAFKGLNDTARMTNDELALSNQRLQNDIDKLEGKHENTLALMLLEARVQADKLADSLVKDLAALQEVLKKEEVNGWKEFWGAGAATSDIGDRIKALREQVVGIGERTNEEVRGAETPAAARAAQDVGNRELANAYSLAIAQLTEQIQAARRAALPKMITTGGAYGDPHQVTVAGQKETGRIAQLQGAISRLRDEQDNVGLQAAAGNLARKKEELGEPAAGSEESRHPFENRMAELTAQIAAMKARLDAAGRGAAGEVLAKAFGAAEKAIAETNKSLSYLGATLTAGGEKKIRDAELTIAEADAEATWREQLAKSSAGIADKTRAQDLLTAAIGKGYEATRAANVQARLMQELGQHFGDQDWMSNHADDVAGLRAGYGQEFDSQHVAANTESLLKLTEEIRLEKELASAQKDGAEAVRQATLAAKLRSMALTMSVEAFQKASAAEMELYAAQRENAASADVAKLEERIAATERLAKAVMGGAAAVRQATLENRLAEIAREGDSPMPGMVMGRRAMGAIGEDAAEHAKDVAEAAAHTNRVQALDDEIAKLIEAKKTLGDTLPIEIALRDLENERLKAMVQETLALRGARDGVKAFFLEMEEDAKSAASIVYDALNSALDKSEDNLAKLMTGQKTAWGAAFKSIGEDMVKSGIKSLDQKGLGALGKILYPNKKPVGIVKPDGTQLNPFWVRVLGSDGSQPAAPADPGVGGAPNMVKPSPPGIGGQLLGLVGGLLGKLGGVGGQAGGGSPDVTSSISHGDGGIDPSTAGGEGGDIAYGGAMAYGGGVQPGVAYKINDNRSGTEFFIPGRAGSVVPVGARGAGGGDVHNWNIDARGSELGTYSRILQAVHASGKAAASGAVRAVKERARRT